MGKTFPAPEKTERKKERKREVKREVLGEEPIMIPVTGEGVPDGGLLAEIERRWEEPVGEVQEVGGWKREVQEVEWFRI